MLGIHHRRPSQIHRHQAGIYSINRNVLYKVMLPAKLVSQTSHITAQVKVNNNLADAFETHIGLKQEDGLAPPLLSLWP